LPPEPVVQAFKQYLRQKKNRLSISCLHLGLLVTWENSRLDAHQVIILLSGCIMTAHFQAFRFRKIYISITCVKYQPVLRRPLMFKANNSHIYDSR